MGLNNVNGNNKALDLIKSIGIPEEQPQVQEQTEIEEQPQVQEQAQIEESELQEIEIAEGEAAEIAPIEDMSLLSVPADMAKIVKIQPKPQNPVMQMMQKLMQMMMQLLQMMMGKINDEPPEKPQPIERVDLPVKSLYSIPELD